MGPETCVRLVLIGLLLLFVALKLTGDIDWSWWWVVSPGIVFVARLFLTGLIIAWRRATHEVRMESDPRYAVRHHAEKLAEQMRERRR